MIHPQAQVHPQAELDPSVEVGPWCQIGPNVKIGPNTRLMSHVVIDGWTEIGMKNLIFPFATLGLIPQDLKYHGEKSFLKIGDNNTIREAVSVHLGTQAGGGSTRIGNHCLIMGSTHIGHDSQVGDSVIISNASCLAGHVEVQDFATLGGMTGVVQHVRVGAYAYIAGQSGVEKDVPPYAIALGQRPCSLKGANIVGLRRRGFTTEVIQKINESIKLWTRSDVPREQCLLEIESQFGELTEIQRLLEFIKKSRAGVTRS